MAVQTVAAVLSACLESQNSAPMKGLPVDMSSGEWQKKRDFGNCLL